MSLPHANIVFLDAATYGDVSLTHFTDLWECTIYQTTRSNETTQRLAGHTIVVTNKVEIDELILRSPEARDLKLIAVAATGTDIIDRKAASARGVRVCNVPGYATESVAQFTISLILELTTRAAKYGEAVRRGQWEKSPVFALLSYPAVELKGKKLGIVGYGNIGSQLSVVAEALGMRVYFYDVADKLALGNARRCETLDELLEVAETVSLHVDGRPGNAGLFGAEQFAMMRRRSLFLNLCRGFVVDHEALREHLLSGHIAGAALDVFAHEPKSAGDPFSTSLQGLPNVILTPHIGGSTEEAQTDIGRFVAGKLRDYADSGHTTMSVNMPQVQTESRMTGRSRLLHVHQNVPGVLATVNGLLANAHVNIEGQVLSTRGELGYVITDVAGGGLTGELIEKLQGLPETVRLRVLD